MRYLEPLHPEHTFEVLHVGQRIRVLEKDFAPALEAIDRAKIGNQMNEGMIAPYRKVLEQVKK